ncbi:hypothetical protein [Anaerosolibacter sp.]|uniref:hypothetical protein n=1 Tax=Anaerosolibacter sp. TaxID=1872527 RepID=UPI0039EFAE58
MKILNKLQQRVHRLEQAIGDFEEMLNNEEVKKQLDAIAYISQKLKDLNEKREEYIVCIQAITYLEEHLKKDDFRKIITIDEDVID